RTWCPRAPPRRASGRRAGPAASPRARAMRGRDPARGRPRQAPGFRGCGGPARGTSSRTCPLPRAPPGRAAFRPRGPRACDGGSYGRIEQTDGLAVYRSCEGKYGVGPLDTATRAVFAARVASLAPAMDVLVLPACVLDRELRYHYVNAAYCA